MTAADDFPFPHSVHGVVTLSVHALSLITSGDWRFGRDAPKFTGPGEFCELESKTPRAIRVQLGEAENDRHFGNISILPATADIADEAHLNLTLSANECSAILAARFCAREARLRVVVLAGSTKPPDSVFGMTYEVVRYILNIEDVATL